MRLRWQSRLLIGLLGASGLASASCAGDDGSSPEPDPLCVEAANHTDIAWIQDNVFTRSCAGFSACHMGNASSAGDLNLEDGQSETNTVDVPSELATGMVIVKPGQPEESYMMVILGEYGTEDPRLDPSVGTMPYNNELLCPEKRAAIAGWIAEMSGDDTAF
jgi:hypothetical protein